MNIIKSYDFWRQKEAGRTPPFSDGNVYLGYWRFCTKNHDNGGDPVSITLEDGKVLCRIGDRLVTDFDNVFDAKGEKRTNLAELMTWLVDKPVSYQAYSDRMDTGHWPGFKPVEPTIGDNNPPPEGSYEWYRDQIEGLSSQIGALIKKGPAQSQEDADEAGALARRLSNLYSRADKAREAEKRPHLDACNEIQAKWGKILGIAEIYKKVKDAVVLPFTKKAEAERLAKERQQQADADRLRREAEEAQRRADEEAQRIADEQARAAQAGISSPEDDKQAQLALEAAAEEAERIKKEAEEAQRRADETAKSTVKVAAGTGRAISMRTIIEVQLADRRIAAASLKGEPAFLQDLDALLEKHARRLLREQSRRLDGFSYPEKQIAA